MLVQLLFLAPLSAQTIPGRVIEDITTRPLGTVVVMLLDSTDTAVSWAESDSLGFFALEVRGPGPYRVYADRLGYGEVLSDRFSFEELGSTELELRMLAEPLELEGVVVTAEARNLRLERKGFYRRQRASMGYFFDPDDLREQKPLRGSDMLRLIPGVRVMTNRFGGTIPTTWRRGRPCGMKLVVDDYPVGLIDGDSFDNWALPEQMIGMEVYVGGVGAPIEHRGVGTGCGIIMVWTR